MSVSQSQMRRAILDASEAVPEGLVDEAGRPAGKRFDVYRNNVAVSLTEAMEVAFPVILKLVGEEFFHAMASVFLRQHPPTSPMLMHYGTALPPFLRSFKPVRHLAYLPDIARLELALRRSYHAADAAALAPAELQAMSPDQLMAARLGLAPSVELVRSNWPIHAIWRANMHTDAPEPVMQAEDVLITRPEFDPEPQLLPNAGADFIEALQQGDSFAAALGKASAKQANFDLTSTLGALISGGAIIGITKQ